MFAVSALCKIAVKATQITGLAAGRDYLRFFLIRWDGDPRNGSFPFGGI